MNRFVRLGGCAAALGLALVCARCTPPRRDEGQDGRGPGVYDGERLQGIMKHRLNANLSAISLAMFHPEDPDAPAEPYQEVKARALEMAEAAAEVARLAPPRGDAAQFQAKARCLAEVCRMLADAGHERDRQKMLHWYFNAEWACHSCHATFRDRK